MSPENDTPTFSNPGGSAGPTSGVIIILLILVIGALYYWGVAETRKNNPTPLPLIPGDASSTIDYNATSSTTTAQ